MWSCYTWPYPSVSLVLFCPCPILWPHDDKNWLIGKDPDAGKDWREEEKGMREDEMTSVTQWTCIWASSRSWWWEAWSASVHGVSKSQKTWAIKLNLTGNNDMQIHEAFHIWGGGLPWICLQCRTPGFSPWVGKIPWRKAMQPTQNSCMDRFGLLAKIKCRILAWRIPMDTGAWRATLHGVSKSWTCLND